MFKYVQENMRNFVIIGKEKKIVTYLNGVNES